MTFTLLMKIAFFASAACVLYTYAAYPALLCVLARCFGRRRAATAPVSDEQLPDVSVLIAAHDEQAVIERRVRNVLAADYPARKLNVIIASDGCTDKTNQIVGRFADRGVRLLAFAERRGKAATLNRSMPQTRGEIVVLSDANTSMDPQAIRRLVRWFDDPSVGAVCGRLVLVDAESGRNIDGLYWQYETFLKVREGRLGALLGSNGAIYAIRRSAYVPIPNNTIVDDFVIPLRARIANGGGIVYDYDAIAIEETAPDVAGEFRRRARIGAGGFQAMGILWRLLLPTSGWTSFTFWSHKVFRWLCPFWMVLALLSAGALYGSPVFRAALWGQLGFYAAVLMGQLAPAKAKWALPLRAGHMFVAMNVALLLGFFRWLSGAQGGIWRRTERTA